MADDRDEGRDRRRVELLLLLLALLLVLGLLGVGCFRSDRIDEGPGRGALGAPRSSSAPPSGTVGSSARSPDGTGSGAGSVAGGGVFLLFGDVPGPLRPGGPPVVLDLAVHNPLDRAIDVTGITVSVADPSPACPASYFSVTGFRGSAVVPAHSTTTLSEARATGGLPSIRMLETSTDQDGCLGVTLHLVYRATAS